MGSCSYSSKLSFFFTLAYFIFICSEWHRGQPEVPVWRGFRIKERRSPWQCSHNRLYSSIKLVIMWNGTHGPMMSVAAQKSSCKLSYIHHQSIFSLLQGEHFIGPKCMPCLIWVLFLIQHFKCTLPIGYIKKYLNCVFMFVITILFLLSN